MCSISNRTVAIAFWEENDIRTRGGRAASRGGWRSRGGWPSAAPPRPRPGTSHSGPSPASPASIDPPHNQIDHLISLPSDRCVQSSRPERAVDTYLVWLKDVGEEGVRRAVAIRQPNGAAAAEPGVGLGVPQRVVHRLLLLRERRRHRRCW